ncbi:hypothetical protein SK854_47805 [Lentzea sp. BCCO 10_0061]|uniref:Uncharacterized protein n=1 Tax=Lentzea sokolovensis TaxID=3095429 RepID=A0ABU4VEQ6_9PSEU|nr:hypothetical protein [Lentzea sp. BCCO 10_0061]MDX8149895.1 hypothetical protein [Lentzea sp. BCCO 10_0061]
MIRQSDRFVPFCQRVDVARSALPLTPDQSNELARRRGLQADENLEIANATGGNVLRAATRTTDEGDGFALLHKQPRGCGWQVMSGPDRHAETTCAGRVSETTGLRRDPRTDTDQ